MRARPAMMTVIQMLALIVRADWRGSFPFGFARQELGHRRGTEFEVLKGEVVVCAKQGVKGGVSVSRDRQLGGVFGHTSVQRGGMDLILAEPSVDKNRIWKMIKNYNRVG
jgi:hypothetical protein